MKQTNISQRLKLLMSERNLKQVEIISAAQPYCQEYQVKLNKSDLSQYISGKTEPGKEKLFVLSRALNVSEAWLMGRTEDPTPAPYIGEVTVSDEDPQKVQLSQLVAKLNANGLQKLIDYAEDLTDNPKYQKKPTMGQKE